MKRYNVALLALFLTGALNLQSCTEKKSGNAEAEQEAPEMASDEQKVSPLRTDEGKIGNTEVKVQYGSPAVRDRLIWGDLVPYDEVWRTGANEATFVEFSDDVKVEGKELKAGKYSIFTIAKESGDWTVIFNDEWNLEHGHYQYKEENDVLRVEVSPRWENEIQENLSVSVEENGLLIRWEKVSLPITIQ